MDAGLRLAVTARDGAERADLAALRAAALSVGADVWAPGPERVRVAVLAPALSALLLHGADVALLALGLDPHRLAAVFLADLYSRGPARSVALFWPGCGPAPAPAPDLSAALALLRRSRDPLSVTVTAAARRATATFGSLALAATATAPAPAPAPAADLRRRAALLVRGARLCWLVCCLEPARPALAELRLCAGLRGLRGLSGLRPEPDAEPDSDSDPEADRDLAARRWLGLLLEAERLFRAGLGAGSLAHPADLAARVTRWLALEARCLETEPCPADLADLALPRIAEDPAEEPDADSRRDSPADSDPEPDSDSDPEPEDDGERPDGRLFAERLRERARLFADLTDELMAARDRAFLAAEPEPQREGPAGGRRRSVRPGARLEGAELELLRRAAEGSARGAPTEAERKADGDRRGRPREPKEAGARRGDLGSRERRAERQTKRDGKRRDVREPESVRDGARPAVDAPTVKEKMRRSLKKVGVRFSPPTRDRKGKAAGSPTRRPSEEEESTLRRQIRSLRKTREGLIDRRCVLSRERKLRRSLSDDEERRSLEYEEAIEAIDAAIEFKNELICGRGPTPDEAVGRRERGERLSMARLDGLSIEETRTLLCKYFQKVIDLRTTCAGLEAAAGAAQQEAGGWRRRCGDAWAALQHARLNHARRTTTLTARHYQALNQLMDGTTEENESDNSICDINGGYPLPLEYPTRINRQIMESDVDNMTARHRIASTTARFKVKENIVGGNARILDRIHNLANFHQSGIPSQNLKQLQITNSNPTTKVTRQKNKLVIIQEDKLNK